MTAADRTGTTYLEALRIAMGEALEQDDRVFLYGEDIEDPFGGAFKATKGLSTRYPGRVRNTPISEDAIVGAAIGAALEGLRPIVEFQFADFALCGFNQLANHAATTWWRTGRPCPLVARLPSGGTPGGGPFHCQMPEGWATAFPGLVVIAPATVRDAYAMLHAAVACEDPVLLLEHKLLYYHLRDPAFTPGGPIPPLHRAAVLRDGRDCTIVAYGAMVQGALAAAQGLASSGVDAEVVDLRCLKPLDLPTVLGSVARTGRLVVATEAWPYGNVAAEVVAGVCAEGFHLLDAPPRRVTSPDTPIPFHPALWLAHRPDAKRIQHAVRETLGF
ncbi:MAG: alpha-ketoacid dehydrogenase subunit beta [Planctomycetota bacterium]